jgi:protein-disulfide isomerase
MSKKRTSSGKGKNPKRQAIREKRRAQQRRQRILLILGIVVAALVIAAVLIVPSLLPVGEIQTVDPHPRPMEDGRAMGDPNAPVTIEVYEDFQCPACRDFTEQNEPQIVDSYVATGDVYYIFRHYPFLDSQAARKESHQAANASMCAAEQNQFWHYHDTLFANWNGENQGAFSNNRLEAFADAVGLEMNDFITCFGQYRYQDEIDADKASGDGAGVTGTPSVFVNGRILTPGRVPSFSQISEAVEAELANSSN